MSHRTGDQTRERILRVALELFGRDGFDATTVRAIAERCELSDAALYYHFPSKRKILTALWAVPPLRALSADYVPGRPLTNEVLRGLVDKMVTGMAAGDSLMRILVRSILSGDQTAYELREFTRLGWEKTLLPYFETVFGKEEAAIRADALMMLMVGFIYSAQIELGPNFVEISSRPEFREQLHRLVRLAVPLPNEAV